MLIALFSESTFGQCNFTTSSNSLCAGELLLLNVIDPTNNIDYSWDLDGNGTIDTLGSSIDYSLPLFNQDTVLSISLFQNGTFCNSQDISLQAAPDPSIGVPAGLVTLNGNSLKACNGSTSFELQLYNTSQSFQQNIEYTINWGDGSPAETFNNATFNPTSIISHTYNGLGYYPIFVTAQHENGCIYTKVYTFYNGGNPSVGLAIPGNTVGLCAPATLDFPIINAEDNPPGTEYSIFVNGTQVANYNQENLPPVFTYTFEESSCGLTTSTGNYANAFDLQIVAFNPCNSSTATIEPIEISAPPTPLFEVNAPTSICPESTFTFTDQSTGISDILSGNPSSCIDVLNPNWTISGQNGEDWMLISGNLFGSSQIEVQFMDAGVYTVEMTIVSFACGPFTYTQEITVEEAPEIAANFDLETAGNATGGCAPFELELTATTNGTIDNYEWNISPNSSWHFVDSLSMDSAVTTIQFEEGGMYTIQLTATNVCASSTWDTLISILGTPGVDWLPLPDFCENAELSFTTDNLSYFANGDAISSYEWQFAGGTPSSSTEAFPNGIQYDQAGMYPVQLTISNSCGEFVLLDTFEIQEQTSLEMPPNLEVCASALAIQLEATPSGGSWDGPGVAPNGWFNPNEANTGANILHYTYGVDACMTEDFMTITILPAPEVVVNPDQNLCQNAEPFTLEANLEGGNWYHASNELLDTTIINPENLLPGNHLYWYTLENDLGCIGIDSVELTILTIPEIIIPDTSYCNTPGNVLLPLPQPLGGLWTGPGLTDAGGLFNPQEAGGSGVYELWYTFTAENGCSQEEAVSIGVIAPEIVDAGPHQNICQSESNLGIDDLATPPGGHWILEGNHLDSLPQPSELAVGNYLFVYSVGEGSCLVQDSLQLNILEVPEVVAGPDQAFCPEEGTIQLANFYPLGGQWSGPQVSNSVEGIININGLETGTYTYTYSIMDVNSACSNQADLQLIIHPKPNAQFVSPSQNCIFSPFQLENTSQNAISYQWQVGDQDFTTLSPTFAFEQEGVYPISLTAINQFACTDQYLDSIHIIGPPEALFTPSSEEECGSMSVYFENESIGFDTQFYWDFGNGQTSEEAQPNIPIQLEGSMEDTPYFVHLEVSNQCGSDYWTDTLWVLAFPIANFGFTVDTGCSPLQIEFTNVSLGGSGTFFWDFGNGQTSTDSLPVPQIFEAMDSIMNFPISLVYTNPCGSDTLHQEVVVEPEAITAFFNINNTEGCAPFEITLENYSSLGTQVFWDFGDGNISAEENPQYTFETEGTYLITQYANNSCSEDSMQVAIEVLPNPDLSFQFTPNLCTNQEIQFTSTSNNTAGVQWNFGDGTGSNISNPSHVFNQTGTYEIMLSATSPYHGCADSMITPIQIIEAPTASFDLDQYQGCTPLSVQFQNQSDESHFYQWQFGDGNSAVSMHPTHTYLETGHYEITLTVSDEIGCQSEAIVGTIFAFPVPEAQFEIEKEQNCGFPNLIEFHNLSQGAEGYDWTIDGTLESNLVHPTHSFMQAGSYPVQLIASNQYACKDTIENAFQLYDQAVADFGLDSIEGCQNLRAHFQNFSSGNHFFWDFGDGFTSTESSPEHTYFTAGEYDVLLISAFDDACADTLHLESLVDVWAKPKANFRWEEEQINGASTGSIQFINLSEQANTYFWDFGGNQSSTEAHPIYRFEHNGIWKAHLTAFSAEGCQDDTLLTIPHELLKALHVPNAFAPSDGVGETKLFLPKGIGLKEYHLQIFSPYGQLLWESTELKEGEPAQGWDGRLNGEILPQDVYVWKINAIFEDQSTWKGQNFKRMGSVTLLR